MSLGPSGVDEARGVPPPPLAGYTVRPSKQVIIGGQGESMASESRYCPTCGEPINGYGVRGGFAHVCPTPAEIAEACRRLRFGEAVVLNRYGQPIRQQGPHGGVLVQSDDEERAYRAGLAPEPKVDDSLESE